MDEDITKPVKKYYDYISVGKRTKQVVYFVEQHDKPIHTQLFLRENPSLKTVIFTKSKKTADALGTFLKENAIDARVVHGNHRTSQIQEAATAFNSSETELLITTSKIYEILELTNIKRIINYDLPFEAEFYFKSLRAVDEVGEAITFVNIEDEKMLETIEFMMKYDIPQEEIEVFTHTALSKVDKRKKKKPRHKKSKKTKPEIKKED